MEPLFEHRIAVDGFETRVLEQEGDGPGLILLHGYGDSADTWRPLMAELAALDRRAVAVDLPGFGKASDLGPGAVLPQLDAFAGALVEWVARDAGEVVVAGNSLGGVVGLRLAERGDLPLAGVVGVAPAGLEMPRWFEIIERDPVVRTLLALPVPIPPAVLRRSVGEAYRRLAFSRPGVADPRVVASFAAHHASRARVGQLLATGRRLLPELSAEPFDFTQVTCPVLLVWGTRDRMVPHSGAQKVLEALPRTRLELIDGCGHCPQLEATERVAELLLDFPVALGRAA
jgi:pimeloyl-ACP methyl ester carboxylesterase